MSGTHLGVIPSLGSEVICRVAQEFLLCGCPIFVSGVGSLEECLFSASAGSSYRGLDFSSSVQLFVQTLIQAWQESLATRQERALEAKALFSLSTMGQRLDQTFQPYLSRSL
jgi:hypothetical protein